MSEETFKLPGSSYDEICKIIQAYGKLARPSSLEDVSQSIKMHTTVISRNNAFLAAAGIIEGGKLKSATALGQELARAIDYDRNDEISTAWREIVKTNEFLSKMLSAIRIRKSMDITTFQGHIAYSAGQSKTTNTMAGAKAIIDILKSAGLIIEKDGQLISSDISTETNEQIKSEYDKTLQQKGSQEEKQTIVRINHLPANVRDVSINVQINIEVKPEELEGLGQKVKKLLDEITLASADTGIKP